MLADILSGGRWRRIAAKHKDGQSHIVSAGSNYARAWWDGRRWRCGYRGMTYREPILFEPTMALEREG